MSSLYNCVCIFVCVCKYTGALHMHHLIIMTMSANVGEIFSTLIITSSAKHRRAITGPSNRFITQLWQCLSEFSYSWGRTRGRKYLFNEMLCSNILATERKNWANCSLTIVWDEVKRQCLERRAWGGAAEAKSEPFYYIKMLLTNNAYTLVVILLRTYVFIYFFLFEFQ